MSETAVEARGLVRRFGDVTALAGVDISVPQGTVLGLLGPNGAGKTTAVRIFTTVLAPTEGTAQVMGLDVTRHAEEVRTRIGLAGQFAAVDGNLTGRENLILIGRLVHLPRPAIGPRADELLRRFKLDDAGDRQVKTYSGGMRRRLDLAAALVHRPPVLFLDEPTTGLDPEAARQTVDLIEQMSRESGRTFFLCTHNLAEAERLCHRVAVLNRGRLLALGTVPELARSLGRGLWVDIDLVRPLGAAAREGLRRLPGVLEIRADTTRLAVEVETAGATPAVVAELVRQGGEILRVDPRRPTLEDVYFALQEQGT
jgi:ABC-2 type transport system ATP-binding protein